MTGLISFICPEYSPISSAVREVRLSSSSRHWRALTVFVTRISVVVLVSAIAAGADERLAGAAGEHDDARAALGEDVDGLALVRTQRPVALVELDRMRRPRRVAGEVLGRPADLEQLLLDVPARPRVDRRTMPATGGRSAAAGCACCARPRSAPRCRSRCSSSSPSSLRSIVEPAVAADRLADVDRHRRRHGEARPALERREHVVGVVAGRARVPQPEAGDPVGVDVLGRALELGEDRELVARRSRRPGVRLRAAQSGRSAR